MIQGLPSHGELGSESFFHSYMELSGRRSTLQLGHVQQQLERRIWGMLFRRNLKYGVNAADPTAWNTLYERDYVEQQKSQAECVYLYIYIYV